MQGSGGINNTQLQLLMALRVATAIPYLMEVRSVYVLCLNMINYIPQ